MDVVQYNICRQDDANLICNFIIEKNNKTTCYASCHVTYDRYFEFRTRNCYINSNLHIIELETVEEHRNKGYATKLLTYIKNFCNVHKIPTITLDDCSDRSRKPNNIYIKNNFKYVENNEPEMIWQ